MLAFCTGWGCEWVSDRYKSVGYDSVIKFIHYDLFLCRIFGKFTLPTGIGNQYTDGSDCRSGCCRRFCKVLIYNILRGVSFCFFPCCLSITIVSLFCQKYIRLWIFFCTVVVLFLYCYELFSARLWWRSWPYRNIFLYGCGKTHNRMRLRLHVKLFSSGNKFILQACWHILFFIQ